MNKKTIRIAGWALGLSMAVAGIGAAVEASAKSPKETVATTANAAAATSITNGKKYLVTAVYNEQRYYMVPTENAGTGGVSATLISNVTSATEAMCWTFSGSGTTWTISTGDYYLANTNTNNGVKTQSNSQNWTSSFDGSDLTLTGANSRKLSLYNGSNWRCYTSNSGVQTLQIYEYATASYTVTYNSNGADSGSVPTDATAYANGASVTVSGNTGSLAKTNYDFVGWTLNEEGTGTIYGPGDGQTATYTISSSNVTFYAKWVDNRQYFDITTSSEHLSLSGDTHVLQGEDAEIVITADDTWKIPTSITVTGAGEENDNWSYSNGTLTILEVTGPVTVSGTAVPAEIIGIEVEVDPSETSFYLGHDFTHDTATVTATYDDAKGTEVDVTAGCTWSSPDMFTAGNAKKVTVTHTASGMTDTYTINVSNKTPREASVNKVTASRGDWSGTYVILSDDNMIGTSVSSSRIVNADKPTVSDSSITSAVSDEMKWAVSAVTGGYRIRNVGNGKYLASTGSKNQAALVDTATDSKTIWTISYSNGFTIVNKYNSDNSVNATLVNNGDYGWACYANNSSGQAPQLFECVDAVTKDLIKIEANATAVARYIGDSVSTSDFTVTAYYDDGTNASVTATALENAELDLTSNTVTVKYTEGGITKSADVVVAAEERTAVLESLSWAQGGLSLFAGDQLEFSELPAPVAHYEDDDAPYAKALASCEVALYTRSGDSAPYTYTKYGSNLSDGHEFAIGETGKYLGVSYTENDVTVVAYASAPVNVVATINKVYAQVPTYSFNRTTEIKAGDVVTFVNENSEKVASSMGTNIINAASYDGDVTTSFTFTVGKVGDYYTFHNAGGYLGNHSTGTSGNNNAYLDDEIDTENNQNYFTVSFDGNNAVITSVYDSNRKLRFNSDRFCFYGSGQSVVQLYKGVASYEPTGDNIANTNAVAQKAALEFAADFNADMDCEGTNGNTVNVQTKWSALASKFSAKMNSLEGENLDNFKSLFAYAYSVEGGDALQDMLARYDYILSKYNSANYDYGLSDFLNASTDRPEVSEAKNVSFGTGTAFDIGKDSPVLIAVTIGTTSLLAAGSFIFIRRKKEDR